MHYFRLVRGSPPLFAQNTNPTGPANAWRGPKGVIMVLTTRENPEPFTGYSKCFD